MAKVVKLTNSSGSHDYVINCYCGREHILDSNWEFNGDFYKPTFRPSLLCSGNKADGGSLPKCHSFITEGKIQFLTDCEHEFAGQTLDLKEVDPDRWPQSVDPKEVDQS